MYAALKKERKEIDRLMWAAGIIGPLSALPQVILLYANQSSKNVSLWAWGLFAIVAAINLSYATLHKINPLIFYNALWLTVDLIMVVGIIIYN